MSKMRAVDVKGGKGPAESLYISDDVPKPEPKEGQALVKIKAFGLNRIDIFQRSIEKYKPPEAGGKILGIEYSGVIEELGSGTEGSGFKVGDEVFGLSYGGTYAEYLATSVKIMMHRPHHLSWEEAAGVPEVWMTAAQAMYIVNDFQPGQSILWHAGASGVSIAGIQLSKAAGAKNIFCTVSSKEKEDFCKSIGATHALNYKTQDWGEELLKVQEKGVNLIVDYIGADYLASNIKCLDFDGCMTSLAAMSGTKLDGKGIDIAMVGEKRLRIQGSRLRSQGLEYQEKIRNILEEKVLPKLEDGTFKIFVEKVFSWKDIVEAHKLMESNTSKGKIICRVE